MASYRRIEVKPIAGALGAEIANVDLDRLDDETFREIKAAWLEHLVVFFRNQTLTPEQQIAFAKVIADGVAAGEFQVPDVNLAAVCTCTAMVRFFHPQLIAECADKHSPTLDQMIDFVIRGLQAQHRAGSSQSSR